jgi:23S rRNA (cytidine1920-2'-O)/16S rRNA (cytidine1409-2'-O)-methyltransferase
MIMAGSVRVNGQRVDKPGTWVAETDAIELAGGDLPFVSRGGLKLDAALSHFALDVSGMVCLDVGASTGGFTDCLLKRGAARVYAVDVGYGQLAWSLRQDERVVVIERTNIRTLAAAAVPQPVDLAVIDVAFISLRLVVPAVLPFLKAAGLILALIKPQFEVGRGHVGKGGVVSDPRQHAQVISDLTRLFAELRLSSSEALPSPIRGPKGNQEFFVRLRPLD